jgi:SET domain-containing protein
MMLVQTYVAPSQIEGVGIFAAQPIKAGQEIWQFDPVFERVFTTEELVRLSPVQRDYVERYGYSHMDDRSLLVIETDNGRFMNHSERPNTDFTRSDIAFAIVDIAEGTEITCDYGEFEPAYCMQPGRQFTSPSLSNGQIYTSIG